MSPISPDVRGLYFEEFEIGQQFKTAGRTITETDVVNYAGISGDFNQIHTDEQYSQNTPIGKRIAHGLLVLSIASGLAVNTGLMEGTIIVFREIENWKFSKPVFFSDTIHVVLEVTDKKMMSRLGGGLVKLEMKVYNQEDEIVNRGTWAVLMQSKPAA